MAPLNREAKLKWINIKTDGFPKEIAETLKVYGKADVQIKESLTDVLTKHPNVQLWTTGMVSSTLKGRRNRSSQGGLRTSQIASRFRRILRPFRSRRNRIIH